MSRAVSGGLTLLVAMMVVRTSAGPSAQTGTVPTFNRDVAPILFSNCVSCHRPGEVAPMSLRSYVETRPWAAAIKRKVLAREMPPWFADSRYGRFRNARVLTDPQITTLVAWADGGAPEGEGPAPAAPALPPGSSGSMDRPPDYVLQMPLDVDVPAAGEPPYMKLWSRTPFRRDVYLEAVELRPSNRRVTHHSSAGMFSLPPGTRLENGVPVLRNGEPAVAGPVTGNVMVFFVPGGGFQRFPAGMARRMRPSEGVLWSVHYLPTGRPEKDRHTLALWVMKSPPTHEVLTAAASEVHLVEGEEVLAGDDRFLAPIPPHTPSYERTGIIAFREPVTLVGLWPHMHQHGRDMTFIVVYPDGREETVLSVPRYDFNWQIQYMLAEPLKLPAGSAIRATAHYDNSRANRRIGAPERPVEWGLQSWNEMFGPFLEIVYDNRPLPRQQPPDLFASECDPVGLFGAKCP